MAHVRRRTALAAALAAGLVPCSGAAAATGTAAALGGPGRAHRGQAGPLSQAGTGARVRPCARAGPRPPASLMGGEIRRLPTSRRVLVLTFNAAWDESGFAAVLEELRRRGLPATFFPTGRFAEAHPGAVRAVAAASHGLGNHSHSHPYFDGLPTRERAAEVRRADAAIRTASGAEPLPFFRFPYSSTTEDSVADVNDLGYAAIEFTADTNGYLGPQGGMSVNKAVKRAVDAFAPGAILQMHVGSAGDGVVLDAQALPRIIDAAEAEGYEVVDLREFLTEAALR
ncbi:polysaccharide deacetylase family protein [Streptomyces sp. NPDC058612]|uniref:polysaccharide deacetylase family protein n=1 Tax=Streptomyces sp. NPDC058612 TaxID=3346555 RepID=UPI00364D8662